MIPVNSRNYSKLLLAWKKNSRKFPTFQESSRLLVIILEKSYNQINTLFTTAYLPSMSPISGSAETK